MTRPPEVLHAFSGLMLQLYRSARELPAADFQDTVVHLLKPALRFDASMWGTGTLSGAGLAVHSMHLHEQNPQMIEEWQHVNHEDVCAYQCARRPGWVMNVHVPTVFSEKTPAMRDLLRRFAIGNCLVTGNVQKHLSLISWVTLFRESLDRQFSEEERVLFEALMPHVVEALTINRLVNLDHLYTSRNGGRPCLAIADQFGVLYHADPGFAEVLRAEWSAWEGSRLPRALVEAMSRPGTTAFRGSRIRIEVRRLGELFFLRAGALTPLDALTPRETQIAREYSRGYTYREIGASLGISPVTVRNHIQAIYGKLGVSDKAELARLLVSAG